MASLTETAYFTRKLINWSIVALIVYIIVQFMFSVIVVNIKRAIPQKPLKPDNALGPLPALVFPQTSHNTPLSYRLGTLDGTIPEASDTAKVYFMPKERPNFLDLSKAKGAASQLGFRSEPVQQDKNTYQWNDPTNPLRTLTLDIISEHLTLSYVYTNDLSVFAGKIFSSSGKVISDAVDFLRRAGIFKFDIDQINAHVIPLSLSGTELVQAPTVKEADAVRVDFFRAPVEKMKVVTPDPKRGIISITLTGGANEKKVIELKSVYWPASYDLSGRYAIKKSAQAWNELQNGGGFVAQNPNNLEQVTIRKVSLGYYDSYESQLFLQPIFIFEGEGEFVAYVSAIDN